MELNADANEHSQEDLVGFYGDSLDDLHPVYKMQKPENPAEKKKIPKTLLLTQDKNSGRSFILINNKLVPLRPLPIPEDTIKSMCVSKSGDKMKRKEAPVTNSKMHFESRMVKLDTGTKLKLNQKVSDDKVNNLMVVAESDKLKAIAKLESNFNRKIKHSHMRCNLALSKHKNSLLDIIQNLRTDNLYLKTRMRRDRRKMQLLKSKCSTFEREICKYVDEINTLKETIEYINQFHGNKPKTDLEYKNEEIQVNYVENGYVSIKQDYLAANELTAVENRVGGELATVDGSAICISPYDSLIGPIILHKDINMGVDLKIPKMIPVGKGVCNKPVQCVNGQVGINHSARLIIWMCYKMCDKHDEDENYPIHIAVMKNDHGAVRRQCQALKLRNLSVDIENGENLTPLQLAISNKASISIVAELKSFNASFYDTDVSGNNIFHLAVMNQYLKELYKNDLLEKSDHINDFNYQGYTPLMLAVIHKNLEDAEVLIKLDANLNSQDKKTGKTALFHAVESNSLDLVNLLMVNGADTSKRNFAGHTVQDTIAEVEVSAMLKKIFNELEDNSPETRGRKRGREKGPLKMISKKIKI